MVLFSQKYEEDSDLSKLLVIAPNIIVLDRLRTDFDGLKIFSEDPVLPDNGTDGRNWRSDFQLTLHIQDEVGPLNLNGNIFLQIHRVYDDKTPAPTAEMKTRWITSLAKNQRGKPQIRALI